MGEPAKTAPWAWAELRDVQLGDARLVQRLVAIADTFAKNPEESMAQACDNWAATKGTYRFFDNESVDAQEILAGHRRSTLRRWTPPFIITPRRRPTRIGRAFCFHPGGWAHRVPPARLGQPP